MEATEEGLLDKIRPPRLEDAGLEDCALPPESIKEAFLKAASAVRSIISTSDDEAEDSCVDDPWPRTGDSPDSLVGITEGVDGGPGSCVTEKPAGAGGVPEVAGDEVVVAGAGGNEDKTDALVAPDLPCGGGACVDGLEGLKIGEKAKNSSKKSVNADEDDDDDEKTEKPIIVEGGYA
ncbi:uncharacterized protein LOC116003927 [Ipomoea triloba]|uniref:uncharacterized protein LOC116003927 n=1 Tax=Ipomoea triloba TaxID=35885 RepID=UPI00125E0ED9|nr:uncharacterized protein LOC116003927 [Ipomoea triloba]